MSQIGTEKDISLIWKIRRVHSNYVCVCVCVCVCVRERERWGKRWGWMKGQQDGAV